MEVGIAAASGPCLGTQLHGETIPQTQHLDLKLAHSSGEWRSTDWLRVLWASGLLVSQMSESLEPHLGCPGHLPWGVCVLS